MNKLLKILTPEQLKQELEIIGSATKIAEKYGINPITVYTAFEICGIDCIVKPRRDILLTQEVLEQAYAEYGSLKAVGRKLGVDCGTIKRYMQKFGLYFNPQIKRICDDHFFSNENEAIFYVAGFLAADGCVKKRLSSSGNFRYEIQLSLARYDEQHLLLIKELLKSDAKVRQYEVKSNKRNPKWNNSLASSFTITSEIMVNELAKFNIVPAKSLIYTFPEWIINHSLRHHFIRGYNDGDGSFYISKPKNGRTVPQVYFSLCGTNEFLSVVSAIFAEELGIDKKKPRLIKKHYALEYGGNGVLSKITNYLYHDAIIYLPRKYEVAQKANIFASSHEFRSTTMLM
jgi:Staphylococcus phage endonuclease